MGEDDTTSGYTYPNTSDDPDRRDVLRNRFDLRTHSELRKAEYRHTHRRQTEIELGQGPRGKFDAAHLKALHRYILPMFMNGPATPATSVRWWTAAASKRSEFFETRNDVPAWVAHRHGA